MDYIHHVEYIEWLVNAYNITDVSSILLQSIPLFIGDIDLDKGISTIDQSSGYLHLYLVKMHATLLRFYQINGDTLDTKETNRTFNIINSLRITAIRILKKFPDTEKYCITWENTMNLLPMEHDRDKTIYPMPERIQ